ncbi:3-hexulose-6-phosphate synthase [Acidomonas methanolica]|uniref:3-hexulose-6-phosphate synthase n=1 Tax=Acidomonas methanolica TaxID=437 RepID=UPI00211A759F|nr:3-hexulose-6-phosphate synthase [Acidomonas methanolica]MCQ9155750.1 orotidine 5'-phosphate decarboxylase [Acidomonas methanolica]
MKLQTALDLLSTADALKLLIGVAPYVDIIEIGTPLIKIDGLSAVRNVKAAHPDKELFADLKTMDAGELEAKLAFEAGADSVGILGVANDATIAGAVKAARAFGRQVVVDLIGVPAPHRLTRIREMAALGVNRVEVHAGLDEQAIPGYNVVDLLKTVEGAELPLAVAGGVNLSSIGNVKNAGASVAVVGSGIYGAPDPAAAARALREAIG